MIRLNVVGGVLGDSVGILSGGFVELWEPKVDELGWWGGEIRVREALALGMEKRRVSLTTQSGVITGDVFVVGIEPFVGPAPGDAFFRLAFKGTGAPNMTSCSVHYV